VGRLAGRVAVVGVEQRALALRLAAEGATVVLVGEDALQAGHTIAAIEEAGAGRPAFFLTTGDEAELDSLVELVVESFGTPPRLSAPEEGAVG
jgi:NAD(P)-dependent dehydrogenase (short-subunit alcohol dehydrogenase family)